ncbi:hypothetical protein BDW02DRAFT_295924 [Decorospora gaudefroyi]|uniref:Polycomb protein VEFS-Box domain-containing protein n=1 Tax=Decorospora gaudefroyi TaxID=184978 RepID=A0A6A5KHK4_9PLEO|nr:hypothetical protein BDW02DRAFT_295924 [Decorospora gaudefroyi]
MLGHSDRFSGNILLYDYLSRKRAPVFLDRNLTTALQAHQQILDNTFQYRASSDDFRSTWQPPSWQLLNNMVKKRKAGGCFVVDVHAIRSLDSQPGPISSHDPVRKVRPMLRIASTVKVSIIPSSPDIPSTSAPARKATLRGIDRNRDREISVEMDAVTINIQDLGILNQVSPDECYELMMSVTFTSQVDAKEFYEYMGLDASDITFISISYENILQCPRERLLLPLKAAKHQLGIGLEVSMHWNSFSNADESVLADYNRHLMSPVQLSSSYPTPPLDTQTRYQITFVYGNETLVRSELGCVHCSKRKPTDILDLRMHLISWHEYFDYQVTRQGIVEGGVEHWRFESEVADHKADQRQRASAHADEPFNVHVLAPAWPFDRRRFLKGDDSYQRAAKIDKLVKAKPKSPLDIPTVARVPRQRPPDDVQGRPKRAKRVYIVPRAPPGIAFFRSLSKRPLREGEEISESDDELDERWMQIKRHAEIDKETILSKPAKRFLKVFDDSMYDEDLQSDVHAGDACIRFARGQGVRLWQDGTTDEFKKKLEELFADTIISKQVHDAALHIVNSQKPSGGTAVTGLSQQLADLHVQNSQSPQRGKNKPPAPNKDRKGRRNAIVADNGYLTPITAVSTSDVEMQERLPPDTHPLQQDHNPDPPYDLCYCSKDATTTTTGAASRILACSNIASLGLYTTLLPHRVYTNIYH